MKFFRFISSRLFAIILLIASVTYLLFWRAEEAFVDTWILVVPSLIVLSVLVCLIQRMMKTKIKGNYPFIGSIVFHIGLIVIIISFFVSPFFGFQTRIIAPLGLLVNVADDRFTIVIKESEYSSMPFLTVNFKDQISTFDELDNLIDYTAFLDVGSFFYDKYEQKSYEVKVNTPIRIKNNQIMLVDNALSPLFKIEHKDKGVIYNDYLKIEGQFLDDMAVDLGDNGYKMKLRFFPHLIKNIDGTYSNKSRQMINPAFGVKFYTPEERFAYEWKGIMQAGDFFETENYIVTLIDIRRYLEVDVSHDPTYYPFFVGWVLLVFGLILRYSTDKVILRAFQTK